jgi:hypothetical protein
MCLTRSSRRAGGRVTADKSGSLPGCERGGP